MTATKRAVAMAMRVAGKDEGNGERGNSNGNGNKEGNGKEEGDGKKQQQQDNGNRNNDNAANTTTTTMTLKMMTKTTTKKAKTMVRWRRLAVAGGSRGGQRTQRRRWLSVCIFLSKLDSGCCWLLARGQGRQVGGELSLKYSPRKVDIRRYSR